MKVPKCPRARLVAIVLLYGACTEGDAEESDGSGDGAEVDLGQPDIGAASESGTGAAPDSPAGRYHNMGPFFSVGAESAAIESAIVVNYEFSGETVTVTHQDCDALHPSVEYRLERSGDAWLFAPTGGDELTYLGGAVDEVRIHAGEQCELRLVVSTGPVSQEVTLQAGEVCVLDWCDDLQPGVDKILVDYCEGEPEDECKEE